MNPKISIITAVLNNPAGLLKTIQSIQSQTYQNKEYIVIDGGSEGGGVETLKKYPNVISSWISEPDKGISDAFNKGIRRSTGDYLIFLGAGDTFFNKDILSDIFNNLSEEEIHSCDIISGKIQRVSITGMPLWVAPKNIHNFTKNTLLFKLGLPHQGMFVHKRYFNRYGLFDTNLNYAMDYELLLRSFHHFPKIKLIDKIIANWVEGGVGTGKILEIFQEYHEIKMRHKIAPVFLLKLIHLWNSLKYKIRHVA
jgi:glycosyltransferase involved in cell wall biosynthesis